MKKTFILFLVLASNGLVAESYYASGLLRRYENAEQKATATRMEDLADKFITNSFQNLSRAFQWRFASKISDRTHLHQTYDLRYGGRIVLDRKLKVHVNRKGFVESATSDLQKEFMVSLPTTDETQETVQKWKHSIEEEWRKKLGNYRGKITVEPIIWIDPKTQLGKAALDVHVTIDQPWTLRHYIIEEHSGEVLEQKQVARNASASVKVFKKSPYNGGANNATPDSVTLTDLNSTSALRNSFVWVRRERVSRGRATTLEVPPADYTSGFNISPTPTQYDYECAGDATASTTCKNMAFDAVNVYYHISSFRSRIDTYLSQLGATVNWRYDAPINATTGATNTFSVLINPVSLDFGSSGTSDDVNNALYVGEACRSDGSMERCMVFLRPAALSASDAQANCNKSSSTLYDLAREALVVAHEYQHYVTDMISNISFSASANPKVGDALHEAYSDYMAASYVTDLNSTSSTLVGEYALQDCTPLQRELSVLRVYDDSDPANADPHTSGISWASAFWKLRTEYGAEVADLLALKSLFFLSTEPGYFDSIEAVVKADKALYGGAHVSRILSLFYSEVKFTGSVSMGADGIAEVGFKGCGATHMKSGPGSFGFVFSLFWLLSLLGLGRRFGK